MSRFLCGNCRATSILSTLSSGVRSLQPLLKYCVSAADQTPLERNERGLEWCRVVSSDNAKSLRHRYYYQPARDSRNKTTKVNTSDYSQVGNRKTCVTRPSAPRSPAFRTFHHVANQSGDRCRYNLLCQHVFITPTLLHHLNFQQFCKRFGDSGGRSVSW